MTLLPYLNLRRARDGAGNGLKPHYTRCAIVVRYDTDVSWSVGETFRGGMLTTAPGLYRPTMVRPCAGSSAL